MRKKGLLISMAVAALLLTLIFSSTGDAIKTDPSSTTEVSIDGIRFRADGSLPGEAAALSRELARLGVRSPDPLLGSEPPRGGHPVFSEKLVGNGEAASARPPEIPRGLAADHTLRMSGVGRAAELVFGRTEPGRKDIASRLEAQGWKPLSTKGDARSPRMLQQARGKETTVVCLDENEGSFLLFRKLER